MRGVIRLLTYTLCALLCLLALTACAGGCLHPDISDEVIPPTCEEQGYTIRRCSDCPYTYRTAHVEPKGHAPTALTTAPDCNSEGHTEYVCACGYRYTADKIAPLGHALSSETVAPTCIAQGY
ncbi:MAG: hypothetical protein J6R04_02855, partial [Clostridia bacterium]|nr:hypothetical protein [Clostridia bacterium]